MPYINQKGIVHLFLIAFLLLSIIGGVFLVSQRTNLLPKASTDGIDLTIFPRETEVTENENFSLEVAIDSKVKLPAAAEISVNFDPAFLQPVSVTPGTFLPVELKTGEVTANRVTITLGADPANPKSGFGTVATIAFKALQSGSTNVTFGPDTKVSVVGQTDTINQVAELNGSTVTITPRSQQASAKFFLSPATGTVLAGRELAIQVRAQSDQEWANVFTAKLNFDPRLIEVTRIDTDQTFIQNWADRAFDNSSGKISLVGAVPTPGYKTNGTSSLMATVYVKGLATHAIGNVTFDGASAIFSNADNTNILLETSGSAITMFTSTSTRSPNPSASPAVQNQNPPASPSPSPLPSPSPSAVAKEEPSVSPSPVISPSPSASPSPAVSDSPQPPLTEACTIMSADWDGTTQVVREGTLLRLIVTGEGGCEGKDVIYEVKQDAPFWLDTQVANNPASVKFGSNNQAIATWIAEYTPNGPFGMFDPPKYYFKANIAEEGSAVAQSARKISVRKLGASEFRKGDGNRNGKLDLQDLSVLFSRWFDSKSQNPNGFVMEIDLNDDEVINTVDFSAITQVLRILGVLSRIN